VLFTALRWAVLAGAVLPFLYYLAAIYCAWRFFSKRNENSVSFTPPVSILKPVRGLDREAYDNFASFCRQSYPRYEILFGVADDRDPAIPIIQKLIRDFPELPQRLLIGSEDLGSNDKVNRLCRLVREARYDLLVISDSDIRVGPNYLASVVGPLREPRVGVVTCLYRGRAEPLLWPELEDVNLTSNFLAGALVAREMEGVRFSLGATIAITRERLSAIGGFEALTDYFADDYEVGKRVASQGYRVEISPYVVETVSPSYTAREFFEQQLRWALAVRHSRPGGHFGSLFTQGLPWSLGAIVAGHSVFLAAAYLGTYIVLRLAVAWTVGVWGLRDELLRNRFWLVPVSDALGFLIWLLSFGCNRIRWRERSFDVRKGLLVLLPASSPANAPDSGAARRVRVAERD
jgi:ceramide glucosyltransferase